MASSTNDDDNTIVNYRDIYVQQDRPNDEYKSTPPPSTSAFIQSTSGHSDGGGSLTTPSSSTTRVLTGNDVIIITAGNNTLVTAGQSAGGSSSRHDNRGEPPSYEEAINPDAPPPSYDSLFGRVREAHKSSTGMLDFLKNVVILLLGTLGCTIILGITIVIPVCMIVFGSIYLYDCPQGEYIPVYLLVGGGFGVLKQLLHLSTRVRSREEQELERLRQSPTQTLINCFMLGWFIIEYCNKSLYLFTFWLITSVYMTLGFVTVVLCGVSIISIAIHRRT
ncbi:hypothetical protein quinque_000184 [Culex quinquefasciatus]